MRDPRISRSPLVVRADEKVPKDEVWFVNRKGVVVGKIVGLDMREVAGGDGAPLAELLVPPEPED